MEFNQQIAMQNLTQVCRACPATADQHDYLKFVLKTIEEKLNKLAELEKTESK